MRLSLLPLGDEVRGQGANFLTMVLCQHGLVTLEQPVPIFDGLEDIGPAIT
ncbi:MAG: hypothetical protein ACFCVD_17050 [Nodosilinea sp.]